MKPLRALLVGCGLIAQTKHLPAIQTMAGAITLEGVCDTDLKLSQKFAKRAFVSNAYDSLSQALEHLHPELAILCTPPQTHRALSIEALQQGADLLLEKPMALTVEDCEAIATAAEKSGRKLTVAFSQSFTPVVLEAHRQILEGRIGTLVGMHIFLSTPVDYMTSKPNHWAHRLPGGVLSETGPHVIHLAMRFLGSIHEAKVEMRKHQAYAWSLADDFRLNLSCERGTCSASLLYTTHQWAARVDFLGTEGRLALDLESGLLIHHQRSSLTPTAVWRSSFTDATQTLWGLVPLAASRLMGHRPSSHRIILEQFVRAIQQDQPPPILPREGVEVAKVLEGLAAQVKVPR